MGRLELIPVASAEELARVVASAWLDETELARVAGRPFFVALSGGRIAARLFADFARLARERQAALGHAHFFWADERCVPPEDTQSNYRVALEHLFTPLRIADSQVHRIRGELSPEVAARRATEALRRHAPPGVDALPVLDLVLLGMGEDGHVASLFPGDSESVAPGRAVYRAVVAPKPPPHRVTLDYGVLAAARRAWVLVFGPGKEEALRESLRAGGQTPLARLLRARSDTRLYCEQSLLAGAQPEPVARPTTAGGSPA